MAGDGTSAAADEFVELHNVGSTSFDLNGYRVVYRSATGTTDVLLAAWTSSTVVPAGGYYLIAHATGYNGAASPNVTYNTGSTGALAAAGGGLAFKNTGTNAVIDSVGFGTAANAFVEGAVTPAPAANDSRARLGSGCTDTDNNSADFATQSPSAPRNSASPAVPCGAVTQSLQFSAATYSVNENGGSATVTVTRTGGTTGTVSVNYATSNGTATSGSDYTAASGTLTFNPGDASKTFSVPVIDDSTYEGNETVNLTLSGPSAGAALGSQSSAVLTIVENDPIPNQLIATNCPNPPSVVQGTATSVGVSATDPDGRVTSASITGGGAAGITLDNFVPAAATGGTATATLNVANTVAVGTYNVSIQYSNDDSPTPQTATCTVTVNVQSPPTPAGALVVSQIYGGGGNSGATLKYDYIEIFNRSASTVNLNGWSVQYTSAAGPTGGGNWSGKTNLTGAIAPGQYILVQEASNNTANGADLPVTPDISGGTINMSATDGKVALVNSVNFLSGTCPNTDPNLIDLVGYGSANCFEGVAAAPSPSATNAIFRARNGCKDTDYNAVNFTTGSPSPRNSSTALNVCPAGDEAPEVFSTTPTNGATNVSLTSNVAINFDQNVNVTGSWFQISCSTSGLHTATATGGPTNFTLDPDTDFVGDEQCTVTVFASNVNDQDTQDPPDNMAADYTFGFHTAIPRDPNEHLVMGNPSGAATTDNNNYLLKKDQYAHSYNCQLGRPNWVSWHLDTSWLGSAPRQDDFRNDTTLPTGCYQVQGSDFSGSGFDRGHMTPSADRTSSIPDNSATFLMSNMVAQAPDNNQGPWGDMENDLRALLNNGANELYIVSGPAGIGGTGSSTVNGGFANTIANGNVTVPAKTWKVVMVLPTGTNDLSRVDTSTRTFAVIMPNVQGIRNDDWHKYIATVDQVEALTGYDFFSNVDPAIQAVIEARLDDTYDTTPVANGQSAATAEDTQKAITLTSSDFNVNNVLTYTIVDAPSHGTLSSVTGDQVTYTPGADYNGSDSFTFKVNDGDRDSNTATVSINVTPVNDAPVAVDDTFSTSEDAAAADVNVLGNDTDVDGDTLSVTAVGSAAHGTATLAGGAVKYTPAANYNGADSFTYTVSDGNGGTATGTVAVTISAVNDAPSSPSTPGSVAIPELVPYTFTATASDVDGDTLTFSLVGAPAGATINPSTGEFSWTPSEAQGGTGAPFNFAVRVSDGALSADSNVTITVAEVNSAPSLAPIANQVVLLGGTLTFNASAADGDLPAQTLAYSLTGAYPAGATINPATGAFSWTPTAAQAGQSYTFNVRVTDNGAGPLFAEQPVTVSVGYTWSGFLQPINQDGSSVFKAGQTVPVKFQLTGASAGVTNAVARLYVAKIDDNVVGTEDAAGSTSNATEGNLFRYADGQYIFNLSTKGLTAGTYQLRVDTGDGVLRVVNISLR